MALQLNQVFINLPVRDLNKSMAFYKEIGFEFNAQFTNENAACLVISEHIFAMLQTEEHFKGFTNKEIPDTTTQAQMILAFSAASKEQVDDIVNRAMAAGASKYNDPQDHGFMYGWSFQDLDGHLWEVLYMDPSNLEQ
ncbi:extradiol dioxygenase [Paenibacillus faecis]|uniref:Glyoxalase/bleomycin resistance/extradiol dioxygenase family protein n=1 Tax=Paenibacillus faecis TaxID=862114 RepID=A0A5D0CJZ5_9BACL|nr:MULTISPECIES: VOC family protein [Paenibacillus]MCA1295556.1 VOC family protein [Paenibacillus sp. alder61]TYA10002.1 glyoxalase/bleomycin resistance/extradiol dioxygenase family protein [Paenibacillus faecis]GIO85068.1 extradiol dioxygenase [Paenibacillus faecis]